MKTIIGLAMVLAMAAMARADDVVKKDGAMVLFNGKDLTGWEGNPELWSVKDGAITGQTTREKPTQGNTFLIWKGAMPADFELKVVWRLENGNSGVQYRSKDRGNWVVNGYQADIADNQYLGILYEEGGRGIIGQVGEKVTIGADGKKTPEKVADKKDITGDAKHKEWNEYIITAKGNHIVQKLNGKTTIELIDNQVEKRAMEGILALQLHAGPPMTVQFKEITVRALDK